MPASESLRDWQAHPSYTHEREVGALQELIGDADDMLFIGDYSAVLTAYMADAYDTVHAVTQSETSMPDGVTKHYTVSTYESLPSLNDYDAVVAAWLDWPKRPEELLRTLRGVLRDDAALIVEAADETSEYASILETIKSDIKGSIFNERLRLLEPLTKGFTLERYQVNTSYHFETIDDLILYFNQHAHHEWDRKLSKDEKRRVRRVGEALGYEDLGERSVILKGTPRPT